MKPQRVGRAGGSDRQAVPFERFALHDTGLLQGAVILTGDGEIPVAFLSVGDRVITRDRGLCRVTRIERQSRDVQQIAMNRGALGTARPDRDIRLAADQMLRIGGTLARALFDAEVTLQPARRLLGQEGVSNLGPHRVVLHQIFCEGGPHILYCDGLEMGTADSFALRGAALRAA